MLETMTLAEQINQEIKEAMRQRDQLRLDTLRMLKSKILAVDARGNVSDAEVIKLFKTYYGNLQEALEQSTAANRGEAIDKLKQELSVIEEFLPKVPSKEETKRLVAEAIAESGAKSKKDLGLVMKGVMQKNPNVDGKLAKDLASEHLTE